jgi:hypothetical protein
MHINKNVFNYNDKNSTSNQKKNVNKNLTFTIPPIFFVSFRNFETIMKRLQRHTLGANPPHMKKLEPHSHKTISQ